MTSANEMVKLIQEGRMTSVALVSACLDRIEAENDQLKAWQYVDREAALARAAEMDKRRDHGKPLGRLHGIPIGIKDIIDTKDMPTGLGSAFLKDRTANSDAAVIERLLEEGAVIIGKTVTTPFAFLDPADTRHPINAAHSPGGSSSGSAAAVAAGHVPIAIGSQTNGSTIRPASYCGTYAMKPTSGLISRRGLLQTSETLDQVGLFAATLEDLALVSDCISSYDPADEASLAAPRPHCSKDVADAPPIEPNFVWLNMPYFDRLAADAKEGLMELVDALGGQVEQIDAEHSFKGLVEAHKIIQDYEIARNLKWLLRDHPDEISEKLKATLEHGQTISDEAYAEALGFRTDSITYFETFYRDFDAIIAPSAPGEAPEFGSTGDPIFSTIWTLCGLPCVTLPLLVSETGLPIGAQLIGGREEDGRLLRTARWMQEHLSQMTDNEGD